MLYSGGCGMLARAVSSWQSKIGRCQLLGAAGFAAGCAAAVHLTAYSVSLSSSACSDAVVQGSSAGGNDTIAAALQRILQRLRCIESRLDGNQSVLVVGGGIVGASIALHLTRAGCEVCLVEADGTCRPSVLFHSPQHALASITI